ncbi:MAG: DUF2235 domain-containing protein [Mariprofundus sp.]|nr:DUF2235 domain-containing protein [Mariprofundus sp.]
MSKNIVLCSDGTGQAGGQGFVSNVWRLFKAVDRHHPNKKQVVFHADGVGTENNRFLRAIGGGFGYGLSADICSLYSMLVKTYSESDDIFLFGFSRGAFTVRSLAGMIHHIGILDRQSFHSDQEISTAVQQAYHAYRKNKPLSGVKTHDSKKIKFIGVWDTVDAIGVPVDELREIVYLLAKTRFTRHKDELNASIENAYHALAIDDERKTFHPMLWQEDGFAGNVQQVWFAGVHSNVGGGYPKDSLSFISLDWMMKKAAECGLEFCPSKWLDLTAPNKAFGDYQEQADRNGRIYDSRAGLGVYYRYSPRKIEKLWAAENPAKYPTIHESVLTRIKSGYTTYAPTALPQTFNSMATWSPDLKQQSFNVDLGKAWQCIRMRIKLYYALIISTFLFLLTGMIMDSAKSPCNGHSVCLPIVDFFKDKLPSFMHGWLDYYATNPLILSGFLAVFLILFVAHFRLKKSTERHANEAWHKVI